MLEKLYIWLLNVLFLLVNESKFSIKENKEFLSYLGESIGNENPEIKSDLIDACREARLAGKYQINYFECSLNFS